MEKKYVYNPNRKRIEPKETLCQFCKKNHSSTIENNFYTPIYQEQKRTNLVVYSSVKFKRLPIGIPRCKHCKAIHKFYTALSWVYGILTGISIYLILHFTVHQIFYFLELTSSIIIGVLSQQYLFKPFLIKRAGILTEKQGKKNAPLIQELLLEGWSFKQPSP